ncbi:MAG TPA: hypothetical protein VM183_11875 [Burkholderiales bacterium]|nr:hypothetical protein [Burkholderiales bacterium]
MPRAAFHVCHFMPPGRTFHGLAGYREHADALVWGLQALGHHAEYGLNTINPEATNIAMGLQMLGEAQLDALPPGTVYYNLEQMARRAVEDVKPVLRAAARRFPIWDYCEANLESWRALGARSAEYVKIGWAPVLERVPKPREQDIEVLLYGLPGGERLPLFQALCEAGIRTVFACGLYGAERDALIARAKIVVNASLYTESRIFEIARVSYLLANAKAVLSVLHPDTLVEPDIRDAVMFSPAEGVVRECLALIDDDARRGALEEKGRRVMRARNMSEILRSPVAKLPQA